MIGFTSYSQAQNTGDTIIIASLDYNATTRDTVVDFSSLPNVLFEKILMKYNMRCRDGNICGEWDYSCNTYIHDSTQIDSVVYTHPNTVITGFNGTTFNYNTQPTYDFYQHSQTIFKLLS